MSNDTKSAEDRLRERLNWQPGDVVLTKNPKPAPAPPKKPSR
jgi:hypothetical protein